MMTDQSTHVCANCDKQMVEAGTPVGRAAQLKGATKVLKGGELCYDCAHLPKEKLTKVME